MKLSCVVSFSLIMAFYVSHCFAAESSKFPHTVIIGYIIPGRRSRRELRVAMEPVQLKLDFKAVGRKRKTNSKQEPKEVHRKDGEDEIIYYVDYHGVTTHPSPMPMHP